jgi:hypothetical protein
MGDDAPGAVTCSNCGREVERCWLCEAADCGDPLCYRCVRQGIESSLDPVAGPAMPS